MMDSFDDFSQHLRGSWVGPNLVVLRSVDSTNRLARKVADWLYADDAQVLPTWFLAFEQSAGRGRLGRSWTSTAASGLYATLLCPLAASLEPQTLTRLPINVGVAVCRAARVMLSRPGHPSSAVGLKWPNDLLAGDRKWGGILIEVVDGPDGQRCAVIGIGLNHGGESHQLPDPKATSFRLLADAEQVRLPPLSDFAALICSAVSDQLAASNSMAELMGEYHDLSVHRTGDRLTWGSSEGPIEGSFEGFDDNGYILLRTENGRIKISAGDVLLTARTSVDRADSDAMADDE